MAITWFVICCMAGVFMGWNAYALFRGQEVPSPKTLAVVLGILCIEAFFDAASVFGWVS